MAGDGIKSIRFRQLVCPLKTTFSTSLGRKDHMRSVIVEATLEDGSKGHGECATSFVLPHESADAIKGILSEERPRLTGRKIGDLPVIIATLRKKYRHYPMTVSGLETALFRAQLDHSGTKEHLYFGGALRQIETDITVPFTTNENVLAAWMDYAIKRGFTKYKVKVSGNTADDKRLMAFVTSTIRKLPAPCTVRLDGNQGFTARTYLAFAEFIEKKGFPVELFEQPLKKDDHRGLREITKLSPLPVILDETVFTVRDMELVIDGGLGHGVNIKTAKSGIWESLAILALAKEHGLRLMIGCMTETMVGLSAGINLALGSGSFDYIDLDSVHFINHRKRYGTLEIKGPVYREQGKGGD